MKRTKANIRVQLTYEAFRMNQESHFANIINWNIIKVVGSRLSSITKNFLRCEHFQSTLCIPAA